MTVDRSVLGFPAHSSLGASSMSRWSVCPGSVRLSTGLDTPQSVYAEEGTQAHTVAAQWLQSNGITPECDDEDMIEAVKVYVDHVFGNYDHGDTLLIEHRFDLSLVFPGCFGTCDAVIWKPKTATLKVIDFKYGAGILVEAEANPQLQYYALGALMTLGVPAERIELSIVQPRCSHPNGPIRTASMLAIDLLDFAVDLVQYAERTQAVDAPLVPGDHCRFCPALRVCPAVAATRQAVAKMEFCQELTYDPEQLKLALDSLPVLRALIKHIDEFAYAEAEAGRCPPGYKLVAKRPTRKWRDESEVASYLTVLNVERDAIYDMPSVKSPAQLERVIPDFKDLLKKFIVSESSGHTLVPVTDKRPAVRPSAKDEFMIEGVSNPIIG